MRNELAEVESAPEGTRNQRLNIAAYNLKGLILAGTLDEATVYDDLTEAARRAGLDEAEIAGTIRSGFNAQTEARTVPEKAPGPSLRVVGERPSQASYEGGNGGNEDVWGEVPPIDAGDWLYSTDDTVVELWGVGDDILWAEGEALLIAGGQGLGKSTLAGQLVRAQLGLQPTVLDLPVTPVDRPILYLGMDRPRQLRRSMRRQFSEEEMDLIRGRLLVRPGPPINDMAVDPTLLARMAEAVGAGVVYVDSLKDAAVGLSTDEVGALYNRARQRLLATGANVCELHHLKKPNADTTGGVADVYGSTWLTGGAGSVIVLTGEPGDLVVRFRHVKTPSNEVGPWRLVLNPDEGSFTVQRCDLLKSVKNTGADGLTAEDAARDLYERNRPSGSEIKKAERQLMRLTNQGLLRRVEGIRGPVWFLVENRLDDVG